MISCAHIPLPLKRLLLASFFLGLNAKARSRKGRRGLNTEKLRGFAEGLRGRFGFCGQITFAPFRLGVLFNGFNAKPRSRKVGEWVKGKSYITFAPFRLPVQYLISVSLCLCVSSLQAQVPDTLISSLRTYYQQKTTAEIAAYSYQEKGKWLKYLPTVGVGFNAGAFSDPDILTANSSSLLPQISFNSRTIYQVKNDKQVRHAKIESLIAQNELAFNEDIRKLRKLLQELTRKEIELRGLQSEKPIRWDLFRIDSTNYQARELKPSGYLRSQLAWAEFNQRIQLQQLSIERIIDDINETARVGEVHSLGITYSDRKGKKD